MQVRPHLLYKPDLMSGSSAPDSSANYQLLDRVVNVRQGYSVPLGLRGTVIGIKNASKALDVVYEILFDNEFPGGLPLKGAQESPNRVYNLPFWAMINLSHGKRQKMERERQGKPTAVVRPSGSGLNKQSQQGEASRNQPKQTYSSYKASLEHQPAPPKQAVQQPKLLTKKKSDNAIAGASAAPSTKPTSSANRIPAKTAPSPSSLPSPFMDIWNSLVQQHEQQQQQQNAAPTQVVKPQDPPKNQQQAQPKTKAMDPPVPVAPRLPSLQEAARNLPKITKLPKGPSGPTMAPIIAHVPQPPPCIPLPPETILQTNLPPPMPAPVSIPVGHSLSVQQLFDMASQAAIVNPIIPQQPPPPIFSYCLQLMDFIQKKGIILHNLFVD